MRALLKFLIKHNHWFLFLLLEGISFVLIISFNNYQKATFFTSANSIVGNVYSTVNNVESYFALKDENATLLGHNKKLMNEVETLKEALRQMSDSTMLAEKQLRETKAEGYYYTTGRVVNNSVNKVNNFLTIDRGTADNIEGFMGVFNSKGVVGITYTSSQNFTVVMSLLNSKSTISCKVKNNEFCTLKWDGKDTRYSYLIDLPRYEIFEQGDTVVTNGYSLIFPEGIPVGRIDRLEDSDDGQSYRARVELFVNFSEVDNVFVVGNSQKNEYDSLMQETKGE